MRRASSACLFGLAALALSACAKEPGGFPSLARRPAERINTPAPDAAPSPEPAPAPANPALLARIADLVAKARNADTRFQARAGGARSLVAAAAGAPVASEAWSVATVALAELEAARSEATIALADLDTLHARAVVDGTESAALANARQELVALVGEEDRVLGELSSKLSQ